jgi:tRNA (guanine-N7-)-methyltransferase
MHADGVEVLRRMVAPATLAGVRMFFPDPWPKARHHKRRLVRPDLMALTAERIRPGGLLHAATDWSDYAAKMLAVLSAEPLLCNEYDGFAPRPPWRPITRFEAKGIRKGHTIHDLLFRRM